MIKNDYVHTKHLRTLLQEDMKRRYTEFTLIFKKLRIFGISFFFYQSLYLQLLNGANRTIHRNTLVPLLPLVAHIVLLWCIKDFTKNNTMEEPLYHIVSPNYWMKVHTLHIQ